MTASGVTTIDSRVIFLLATASKAWEPLAVAQRRSEMPFSMVLVGCESAKLMFVILILLPSRGVGKVLTYRFARAFAPPAALLALCNHGLGYAAPRIGPLTYQIIFKAASVVGVAFLSWALLDEKLNMMQYGALALSFFGAHLCLVSPASSASRARLDLQESPDNLGTSSEYATAWLAGILACLCGALALAASAVLFERATRELPADWVQHVGAYAAWGWLVNLAVLLAFHSEAVLFQPTVLLANVLSQDCVASLSIACADITMAAFLTCHGANAYSHCRLLALGLSAAIATTTFGELLNFHFVVGSALVCAGGWVHRMPPVDLGCASCELPCYADMLLSRCDSRSSSWCDWILRRIPRWCVHHQHPQYTRLPAPTIGIHSS